MRWLLFLTAVLVPTLAVGAPLPCGTPDFLPTLEAPREFPTATTRDKSERNPYGVPNAQATDDFVIRWGNSGGVDLGAIDDLAEALEDAWQTQIIDLDHPAPPSTDSTKMNVYIGDTGSGSPSGAGAGGYFTGDDEGYPMLVVALASLQAGGDWLRVVALHEFYHSVQWGLESYGYGDGDPGAWYWEATASWIPSVTDPSSSANGSFLFGFGLLPHTSVDSFDYPDTGALAEYHQYGAFIFPTWLMEDGLPPSVIRNTWVSPAGGTNDPLEALRAELATYERDLDVDFADFAAHNAFWDYVHGDAWAAQIEATQGQFPSAAPVTLELDGPTDGPVSPPPGLRPARYGANIVRLDDALGADLVLRASFDATGSAGSDATWRARLVRRTGASLDYQEVTTAELAEGVEIGDGGALAFVVTVVSPTRRAGEVFDWEVSLDAPAIPGDDDDTTGDDDDSAAGDDDDDGGGGGRSGAGCGSCAGGSGTLAWLLLGYSTAIPLRRRRSEASSRSVPSGNSAAKSR